MRIVTLNTWKNEGRYARRLALMAEGLTALAPDVVCLQEAFQAQSWDTAAHLGAALSLKVAAAPARRKVRVHDGQAVESASGLAILSRDPPAAAGRVELPSCPADGERIAQWAQILPDLRILNLHLTHLRGPEAAALRGRQLTLALAEGAPPRMPTVVAGDFNAPAMALELADLAPALDPDAPATLQGERLCQAQPGGRAIDHLALVGPGIWRVVGRFNSLNQPDADGFFPSDHACVVMDIERT